MPKPCSRPGCTGRAVAQLAYSYALCEVEVCPIDPHPVPGNYVLCQAHLDRFTTPKGWTLISKEIPPSQPHLDTDIEALAAEIRRVGGLGSNPRSDDLDGTEYTLSGRSNLVMLTSRAHLRVVADSASYDSRSS